MNNYYNEEDSNSSKLIEDLKKLPKVQAPDDFEFNLMTRIQNKNFGTVEDTRPKFNLIKFLAPSAIVATAVLLFFIFYPKSQELPLPTSIHQPETITTSPGNSNKAENAAAKDLAFNGTSKKSVEKYPIPNNSASVQRITAPVSGSNKMDELIHNRNSVSLDDYISGESTNQRNLSRGSVVTSEDQVPDFDGFFVKQKMDAATLKRYREVVDSLKKAQLKLDSLKKASKLP